MARHYYIAEPYPDELIGSVLMRTARHRGLGNKRFAKLIIGSAQSRFPLLMSLQLQHIASCTRASPAELLHHHTPFRFITAFMSQEETERFAVAFEKGSLGSYSALAQSATIGSRQPRYCPDCIKADRDQYGESYWHRKHNLPFIEICPIHGTPLRQMQRKMRTITVHAPPDECKGFQTVALIDGEVAAWLAAQSLATLEVTFRQSVDDWFSRYRNIADQRSFPRVGVGLCGKSFCHGLQAFYGARFFEQYGWVFDDDGRGWPSLMLRAKNDTALVAGKHLIIQAYLKFGPTPVKQLCCPPGPKTRNFKHLDKQLYARLKERMAREPVKGRPTARVLMEELGNWGTYRHHMGELPATKALVADWYHAYQALRKAGRAK